MTNRIIFATGNEGKMREIRSILEDLGLEVLSMKEAGIQADVVEDGTTFEANALIKAKAIAQAAASMAGAADGTGDIATGINGTINGTIGTAGKKDGVIILADDSGLEIDYLNREPGVYSARYMGEDTSYEIKNQNLLDRLRGVPRQDRTARFVCAIAAVFPDGSCETVTAAMEGIIGSEARGENGFGYDPIFVLPEYGCSTAELTMEQKNEASHRGKALRKMKKIIQEKLGR